MADVTKVVQVVFNARDEISNKVGSIGSSIGNIASPIASVTGSLLKFEAAAATAGVAMVGLSVAAAGKFSDSFNEITTLISAPTTQLDAFKKTLLAYSSTSTQALGDITAATYNAVSAGIAFEDATASLSVAERLAVAGNASLNDSLKLVTSSMNAYGAGTDEAGRYSDIFFTTVKNGVTTIPELSASLANVTGIAASTKVPIEELGAAIATMTSKGTATAESTTQLKALLSALLNPTNAAAKEFDKLGVSYGAAALESLGMVGILKQVNKATGGSVDMASKLFTSQEALSAVLTLSNDGFKTMDRNMNAMNASSGAAEAAFSKMANNFSFSNQKMANSINATLIGFGDPLLKEYGNVATAISAVFNSVGIGIEQGALQDVTLAIELWASGMVNILNDVAANMPVALGAVDFAPFLDALSLVSSAFGDVFKGIDISQPEGLANAMQGVVDIASSLVSATIGVVEILATVGGAIVDAINAWASLDSGTQKFIGTIGGMAIAMTALAPVVSATTTVVLLLNMAVRKNPFVALASAVIAAGGAIYAFSSSTSESTAKMDALVASSRRLKAEAEFSAMVDSGVSVQSAFANLSDEMRNSLSPSFVASAKEAGALAEKQAMLATAVGAMGSGVLNAGDALKFLTANGYSAAEAQAALADAIVSTELAAKQQQDAQDSLASALEVVSIHATGVTQAIVNMRKEGKTATQIQQALTTAAKDSGYAYDDYVSALDRTSIKEQKLGEIQALREKAWRLRDEAIAEHNAAKMSQSDAIQMTIDKMDAETEASNNATLAQRKQTEEQGKNAGTALSTLQKLQLGWKEVREQEATKRFKIKASVDIESIKAATSIATEAFKSINDVFSSSGDLMASLFTGLNGASFSDKPAFMDAIKGEQKIRQQQLEKQSELIDSNIRMMDSITAANSRPMVLDIQAQGMEIELEAFMWKILERIQLRVAASRDEFLLGVGSL